MLNYDLIQKTHELIKEYVVKTPVTFSTTLTTDQRNVFLKNESLQQTRSFKLRGAFSKLLRLTEEEKKRGVIAISSGNHGIAVSYAAKKLGIEKVLIFVPKITPISKINQIAYYGGQVIAKGDCYDEAHEIGMAYVKSHQMMYIDGWDEDPLVYAGQGTIGIELINQLKNIDSVLLPIGGGGLVTGVAMALKHHNPNIKIIGIQTEACPAMLNSFKEKIHHHDYPTKPSCCEALVGGIGRLSYEYGQKYIDDILLVKESSILEATKHMMLEEHMILETSSCTVVAALNDHQDYDFGKNVVLVLSGNNINNEIFKKLMK